MGNSQSQDEKTFQEEIDFEGEQWINITKEGDVEVSPPSDFREGPVTLTDLLNAHARGDEVVVSAPSGFRKGPSLQVTAEVQEVETQVAKDSA